MWITPSLWFKKSNSNIDRGLPNNTMQITKKRFLERIKQTSTFSTYDFFYNMSYVIIPEIDTKGREDFFQMFYNCENLVTIPQLDTSNGTDFGYMFYNCKSLIKLPQLDTSNGTDFYYMFYNCGSLKTISTLNLSKGESFRYMFTGCYSLENITIEGTIKIKSNDLNLSNSKKLTVDSIMSFINAFEDNTGEETQYTVTFGATNLAKLTEEQIAIVTNKNILLA